VQASAQPADCPEQIFHHATVFVCRDEYKTKLP